MEKFTFTYTSENLGEVTVTHTDRNKKDGIDFMKLSAGNKILTTILIPFDTNPANAMKLIFDAIESLDYNG